MSLKKLGRYDLIRVLGKGAMGIVYEGRDPNLDRRVAIKTVKVENLSEEAAAEYEARFRTEARSAARLQHPNIVSVYDSDRDGDIAFLVMEYIQGDDLKHHIDKGVRYSLEQSLKMIRDLLAALDYAHKQGIVHRDIKPANLLIEPGGRVKLTDFGVARIQDSGEATRTQGSMVGTLKYMSPEQVQGQKIDSRADLFSVGVVLYQLLTDKRPFDGDNDFSIIHQIIGQTPAAPTSVNARLPSAIDAVVARALAKDRDQRFATARDFATALQSAIRRAEDATVVPPADPFKKPVDEGAGTGSKGTGASMASTATSGTSGSTATVTQELELVYWKDIKDSTDPEELEGFLGKFPAGIYADLARRRLRKLASGSLPDQTVLGGLTNAASDQDMEATRLRVEPARMPAAVAAAATVAAAEPAAAVPAPEAVVPPAVEAPAPSTAPVVADATRTLVEPRPPAPAEAAEPPPAAASPEAAPPDLTSSAPARKKPPVAVFAGAGAVVLAGIVAFAMMGKGGDKAAAVPPAPQAAASQPAVVVAAAATTVAVPATEPAAAAASDPAAAKPAAVAASAPRKPASAPKPKKTASAPAAAVATPVAPQPAATEPARETTRATVTTAPTQRLVPPAETCKDKVFLSKQFCLQEECAKPAFRSFPACVRLREETKLREDSKITN
ncbi:MAG: serine/threonine protein kinase [Burkholderiales bacterium]|nr:serine/threonine protein kinase [Burkholderiales bacterium]